MTTATFGAQATLRDGRRLQDRDPGLVWLVAILAAITALRLLASILSPSELGFDEAQYWAWSRHLQFGYFTKPPLIAWLISAETAVCGTGAACVRAASPLLHLGTALVLAGLGRMLYGPAVGFWTGIFFILMPGIALSSGLMTTDTPLLFFWSLALAALLAYARRPSLLRAVLFAVATALGVYAKYAMLFLPAAFALAVIATPSLRARVKVRDVLIALAIIAVMILPNILWNAANNFATFEHTGKDNIGWSLSRINGRKGFEFIVAQFGVAGPIVFGAMIQSLLLRKRSATPDVDRLLLWLSWPILIAITAQGFLSRANANWGATAYPAGVILATALVVQHRRQIFFFANLVICGLCAVVILLVTAFLDPSSASGPFRQYRQLSGWEDTGTALADLAKKAGARSIVLEGRALTAGVIWGMRDQPISLYAYLPEGEAPDDQFEIDTPWNRHDLKPGTLLFGISEKEAAEIGVHEVSRISAPLYFNHDGSMPVYGLVDAEATSPKPPMPPGDR